MGGLKREEPILLSFHLSEIVWNERSSPQDPEGKAVTLPLVKDGPFIS